MTKSANNTAAQSNLQTAFTGAKTYFEAANQTYTGIFGSTTVSNINQSTPDCSSSPADQLVGFNVISITTGNVYVALTSYSAPTKDCWGILNHGRLALPCGARPAVGTYFGSSRTRQRPPARQRRPASRALSRTGSRPDS